MPHAPTDLAHLVDLSKKQHAKDTIVLSRICQYLRPGTILEIGAGCGQLSYELQALGYNVIGSDIEPLFVQHMRSRGLKAMMVDATQISRSLTEPVENILTQGVSTLVTGRLDLVKQTYATIYENLVPTGRLIFIFPITTPTFFGPPRWSTLKDHLPIIALTGFRNVAIFRSQILPSAWYEQMSKWMATLLENRVGAHIGIRHVLVLER